MHLAPLIVLLIGSIILKVIFKYPWQVLLAILIVGCAITGVVVVIDHNIQTNDTEVWSGQVVGWQHNEEYDQLVTDYSTDSKGNIKTSTHWQHFPATNSIKTSDGGWISVDVSNDGKRFDDSWPNSTQELEQMWPYGTPSASTHTYENKVQASYSVFKHENIDIKQFPDLPEYPSKEHNYIYIDRILGDVPNKEDALYILNKWNTKLNEQIPDPEKPGKTRSWKQVNLIFVNIGEDKPEEYGFALQDKWEGGNKNDFVVSFSMGNDGTVNWVYPFSWSETEILKLEVRDYIMDLKKIDDFVPVVDRVSSMVADKFVRKQFADFSYLQTDIGTSTPAMVILWVLNLVILIAMVLSCIEAKIPTERY